MSRKADEAPQIAPQPLKPHRKAFWLLLMTFAVWLAVLLVMYFKTVYPHRHPSAATRPGASDRPSAPR